MKSHNIVLTQWIDQTSSNCMEVDWPKVHKQCKPTKLQMLKDLEEKGKCQLVLEKKKKKSRLVAEFFDYATLQMFCDEHQV